MPELPEVETVRRALAPALEGRVLERVSLRRGDLRKPFPEGFAERLTGRRVGRVGRRAKYLLLFLDDGWVVVAHLGMSGRFRIFEGTPPPLEAHDHVILETDTGTTIRFNDTRRFGLMDLANANALDHHPLLSGLGPEPLEPGFDGPALAARLAGRRTPIKVALMDQRIVAGLGNIYASECLFRAAISPRRSAAAITGKRATRLTAAIREVLSEAIAAGGSSLRDHRQPSGELGYFQHGFAVYERTGLTCPGCTCDAKQTGGVRRIIQGGRSTFYCATRQR
jgi:formamidopyrimidine-DNA glycosylase